MRFLYRAVLSHALVAAPPAAALGYLVVDVNRSALVSEVQGVHLAVAQALERQISARVEATARTIAEAERILDTTEVPIESRQLTLKALVAEGTAECVTLYRPDGTPDTRIGNCRNHPEAISDVVQSELASGAFAVTDARFEAAGGSVEVIVAWRRDAEVLGFISAPLPLSRLADELGRLAERHLGTSGEIDVVDGSGRYVLSSRPRQLGTKAPSESPFGLISGQVRQGAAAIDIGGAVSFDGEGGKRLGVMVSAPKLKWLIGASRPESLAFASLAEVKRRTAALAVFAALLGAFLAVILARGVVAPIEAITAAVRRVARGGFRDKIAVPKDPDLAKLASSFNEMTTELDHQRKEAQEKTQLRLKLARYLPPDALHQILSSEMAARVESRESDLSVVYADLIRVGQSSAAPRPEELVQVLSQFFTAAVASIQRHGGRVDPFSGDALIAVFDKAEVPDHLEAATRAAIDVVVDGSTVSERLAGRTSSRYASSAGVATGRGRMSTTENGDVSVSGPLVEEALSLQRESKPGTVLLASQAAITLSPQSELSPNVRRERLSDGRLEISTA
ncbi:MAG: HAMP domain-containing protein [Deltaproteobacteria bacterium]|nr:HAMP domain-containing protein [Deltaproteobacteria bacterium]